MIIYLPSINTSTIRSEANHPSLFLGDYLSSSWTIFPSAFDIYETHRGCPESLFRKAGKNKLITDRDLYVEWLSL
mgnify:CR=1 FL=1